MIKPLEWTADQDIACYESQRVLHGHTYSVWRSIEPGELPWMVAIGTDTDSETLGRFGSPAAGKAACQAHYESAVMDCLDGKSCES